MRSGGRGGFLFWFLWGLFAWSPQGPAAAGEAPARERQLFEDVFGKPAPTRAQEVPLSLVVNGEPRGDLAAVIAAPGRPLTLDGAALVERIKALVDPEAIEALEAEMTADRRIGLDGIRRAGFEAAYDATLLRLELAVPPELSRTVEIGLRSRGPPRAAGEILAPSPFTAYMNFRSGVDYVHRTPLTGTPEGRQPARVDLEAAVQFRGTVIEGAAFYTERGQPSWQRGDVRLVRDDPPRRLRKTFGDFSPGTAGFQSARGLGGFNLARNFSLQPYRATEPIARTSYLLKRPSKVEVFVNERLVRTLQQAPGSYEVKDLPFATGPNDVRLRITDDVGNVEELLFPFFFDSQLLARGEEEFSYSIGLPSRVEGGRRKYDEDLTTISAFHRAGLSDTLTVGGNFQGDARQQMAGVEALWASALGTLRVDAAASRTDEAGSDLSLRVQHRFLRPGGPESTNPNLSLSAQFTGRRFATLGTTAPDNTVAASYSARYSQRLWGDLSVGVGFSYDNARGGRRNTDSENVSLSYRVSRRIRATVSIDRAVRATGPVERRIFFSLSAQLGEGRQTMTATRDTQTNTSRVDWNYSQTQAVGTFSGSAAAQRSGDSESLTGTANYTGNRFSASLSHDELLPRADSEASTSRSSLRLGAALVYADGVAALSRPVTNSFALFVPHPALAQRRIGVDPAEDEYRAESDFLGPAVLPDLQPYIRRNVSIEAPELPPGFDLGPTVHTLQPTYKSGTIVRIGTDATVFLGGTLRDATGRLVVLQAGRAYALDDPEREPVLLFTNRSGRFRAEGFRAGRYEIRMFFDPGAAVVFTIPEDASGIYEIGTLALPVDAPPTRAR